MPRLRWATMKFVLYLDGIMTRFVDGERLLLIPLIPCKSWGWTLSTVKRSPVSNELISHTRDLGLFRFLKP